MPLTSDDLVAAVRAELERVHGPAYAGQCLLSHSHGWFYFSTPREMIGRGRYAPDPLTRPMRRRQVEALLEELRAQESKKRFWKF